MKEKEEAMKRTILSILITTMMLVSLTACGGRNSGSGGGDIPPEIEPTTEVATEPPAVIETTNTLEAWDFCFNLPEYYGEPAYADEKGYRYDISDEAVIDMTATYIPNLDDGVYNFNAQRESTEQRPVLDTQDITVGDLKGIKQTLDMYDGADERTWILVDEENKRIFLFTVLQNENKNSRDYFADFEEVLASMTRTYIMGFDDGQKISARQTI